MDLNEQLAVVTGVSKGIGKCVVEQLLEKGAKVAGWGRTEPDIDHENFRFYHADVRNYESLEGAYKLTERDFGNAPSIMINNAGLGYFGYIEDYTIEQWHELFETNVNSIFYTSKLVVPGMKEKNKGHIINVASVAALQGNPQGSAYHGTKFAVRGISDSLFKELRDFGIKVSCVFPGSTKTDFFQNAPGVDAHDYMMKPEEVAEQMVNLLETNDNFLVNEVAFRPLQPKGPPQK